MAAERPRGPVVLAVDVAGDRAADGDVLGAGNDRHHPASRDERASSSPIVAPACAVTVPLALVELEAPQLCGLEHQAAR